MKKAILLILSCLLSLTILNSEERKMLVFDLNAESTHNFEIIKEVQSNKDFQFNQVFFYEPSLTSSGDLSLSYDKNYETQTYSLSTYDENGNVNSIDFGEKTIQKVNDYGRYYTIAEYLEPPMPGRHGRKTKVTLYDNNHKKYWEKIYPKGCVVMDINSNGRGFVSDYIDMSISIVYTDGNIKTLFNEKELFHEKTIEKMQNDMVWTQIFCKMTDANIFMFNAEGHSRSDETFTFETGAEFRLYSLDGELLYTEDVHTNLFKGDINSSRNGSFTYIQTNEDIGFVYDLNKKKRLLELEGYTGKILYSEDESIALIDGNVIDLSTGDILQYMATGFHATIANKDYPYVAFVYGDELYVADYKTGNLIIKDKLADKYITTTRGKIQISGDGKEISVVFNDMYRKYRIGGKK